MASIDDVLARYPQWHSIDSSAHSWQRRGAVGAHLRQRVHGDIDLSKCEPAASIWDVDWAAATNFKRSDGGRSSGVYFVLLPGQRCVVVKPDAEVVADYCGHLIGTALGVRAPEMRCVLTASEEGLALEAALSRLDAAKPLKQRSSPPVAAVLAAVPTCLVMEFVPGVSLKGLAITALFDPPAAAARCERVFGPRGELSPSGREQLQMLGRTLAFDILIHNYDRLPCIWGNDGNSENVMIDAEDRVVAIDSMMSAFDPHDPRSAPLFGEYKRKVAALVGEVCASPRAPHAAFAPLRRLLLHGSGDESSEAYCPPLDYDIGVAGVLEVQQGFSAAIADIAALPPTAFADLPELLHLFLGGPGGGDTRCNPAFVGSIAAIFRRATRRPSSGCTRAGRPSGRPGPARSTRAPRCATRATRPWGCGPGSAQRLSRASRRLC